ncbi:MAG: hypothetical protein HZA91_08760 [Verrucomicrobia bacterium]|nr:hypothetical protein [Verrucomicrobiota bacterium]
MNDLLPHWLAARIRRAAVFTCLGWCVPLGAATILFTTITACLAGGVFDQKFPPLFWMAVFFTAMVLLGREVYAGLRVYFQPASSPEVAYLRRCGDVTVVASYITRELQGPGNANFGPETTVTPGWLVVCGGSRLAFRRIEDLAWAFPKTETFRINFVIPVWRRHFVVLRSAVAPEAEARCSPGETARLLQFLSERRPDIILGYNDEAEKLWQADPTAFLNATKDKRP